MLGQRRDVQPMKSKSVAAQCSSRPLSAGIWRVAPAPLSISTFSLLHVRSHHPSSIIILALRACLDATNTFSRGNEFHSLSVVHKKTEVSYFDPKSCCLGKGKKPTRGVMWSYFPNCQTLTTYPLERITVESWTSLITGDMSN